LITARDIATPRGSMASPAQTAPFATSLQERLLLIVLFVTVLASSVAFIEPSPHDALMGVLAVACLIAGVKLERPLLVPLILLLVWNASGMLALTHVPDGEKTVQYTATSIYLAVAGIMFACIFAQNSVQRLTAMRIAYVITAIGAVITGALGYFNILGTGEMFAPLGRALGAFKDPNVFGPFLIWPTLFLLDRMVARRARFTDAIVAGILLFGLLLSFSRGAWFHFAVSCLVMIVLAFVTAPTPQARLRILALSLTTIGLCAVFVVFLLSFPAISEMFATRAQLIQSYDVGQGGRFLLQELALSAVLQFPNGMGPFEFARVYGLQQHNVYLQAFLVYGWVGGLSYVLLLITTVLTGLRAAMMQTPWQPYLITAVAAFIGEMAEGFVIDTDHWRHFYLLLGMVWGLSAASVRSAQTRRMAPAAGVPAATLPAARG
jgi:hypothetical protein